ncbi:transcription factor HES-7.1-A-like isoform X2 [Hemicordylus capensis]|uniref:transcription factor HES-7.1-A-like isoform X2 n=1 Tax=Hemicordylus capensis TaxID=884348 RepID=UPI0023024FA5|nr:transcription factor HES-7.1-A-like isoform X2 [Hemicordylus capensis]
MKMTSQKWESKEEKKLLKPLMEKRRRDRMNQSLDRLRVLLFEATQDERLKNPKVEKAEILQKTVQFLKTQPLSETKHKEDALLQRYHSGYRECLTQATHFLRASPGICTGKKAYLMEHICHCMEKIAASPRAELHRPPPPPPAANPSYELPQRYSPDVFAGCSPPLGGAAYVLHPPPTGYPASQGLQARVGGPAQQEGCSRAQQNKLSETRNSAAQSPLQALNVWRPWP